MAGEIIAQGTTAEAYNWHAAIDFNTNYINWEYHRLG